ncbi:AsmA family protein [Brachyspira hyodysenteriae]|uniref:AsmA family protein n=1 Tax=Brachyspira hyodysenteriae TaxID=159 RepID=UPI00063D8C2B|nr:AsmA family protein [Brachyspira hyodysenteriae]KLI32613.1 outer membrane assembly protein AsmA [Brachyspira hyodysenteriae]MDA0022988.1 AsmA family protein [Brachyspira hyodysenteriae]
MKNFFKRKEKTEISSEQENKDNNKKKRRFKKRYIPLILLFLIVVGIAGARIYFNNERMKNLIENIVYSATNRKLEIGDFKYGLLFPKVEMSNVVLYNSDNFNNEENIKIDNFRLKFSLFSLFFLKLHVQDLSIDNLYVYMFTDESGNWNLPDMPPSEPKEEDTNKEPFDFSKLDFLKLKADVENIRINNLALKADSKSFLTNVPNNGLIASLSNYNLHLDLHTKRFSLSQVMGISAPEVLKDIYLKSFISNSLAYNDSSIFFNDNPLFNLDVSYPKNPDGTENKDEIIITFDFEIDDPNFSYNGKKRDDMQFAAHFLARYNIRTQSVSIENLSSELLNDEILKVIASANQIFSGNIGVNLDTLYARLNLDKINGLAAMFVPSLGINMSGMVNVDADKSSGTINNLTNTINVVLDKINFSMGDTIAVNNLNSRTKLNFAFNPNNISREDIKLDHNTTIDRVTALKLYRFSNTDVSFRVLSSLDGALGVLPAINDPNKKSDTVLYIDNVSSKYINSDIKVNGAVKFDDPTDLNINVTSLPIANFSGGLARGSLNLDVHVFGQMINDINTTVNGIIRNFSYNLNGEVSSTATAKLNVLANADLLSQDVKVTELNFDLDNFLNFRSNLDLEGLGLKGGFVNISTLRIAPYAMKNWLSTKLSEILDSLPFEDDIKMTSALGYNLSLDDKFATVTNFSTFYVTEKQYKLQDVTMKVDADVNFGENLYADIREFNLQSPTNKLLVHVNGYFTPIIKNADLNYNVGLDTDNLYLPFGIEIGGLFNVNGNLKNNIADGVFKTDKFFANMDSPDKMSIVLKGLTSNIDYHFDLTPTDNEVTATATRYTPLIEQIPNVFFEQLRVYLKVTPFIDDSIRLRDFSSYVKVQGHGLTIQDLKSSIYIGGEKFDDNLFLTSISNNTAPRRGAIHLPWLNVDLGSFNTSTIKYDMRVLASDINFKYLLAPENREKINDEKLLVNLTADIAGVGVSPLNNIKPTTFFVGISKMSTEFSKFLIEMIRPINPGISTVENIVQFGYDPNSVEFSISANKVFTTFYFRDQNLDKPNQQKQQLIAFEGDKFGLEPMPFSDVISYLEGGN